jgi:hypothetical protein
MDTSVRHTPAFRFRSLTVAAKTILFAGCVFAVAACAAVRLKSDPLDLRLEISRPVAALGDTIRLTAVVTNEGLAPIKLEFANSCAVSFVVTREDGLVVHPVGANLPCSEGPRAVEIGPRQSWRISYLWHVINETELSLQPGRYLVYFSLGDHYFVHDGVKDPNTGQGSAEDTVDVLLP